MLWLTVFKRFVFRLRYNVFNEKAFRVLQLTGIKRFAFRLNDFFNWTMTYRMDSDLPSPAGRILHLNKELVHVDHKHMIGWNHLEGIQSITSDGKNISTRKTKKLAVRWSTKLDIKNVIAEFN